MPAVTRSGDACTGHDGFPPRPSSSASGDVFVNGIAVHRQGDSWSSHGCGSTSHAVLASGSGTVFVNGKMIGRIGDPVDCGSTVAEGSSDVFAGG